MLQFKRGYVALVLGVTTLGFTAAGDGCGRSDPGQRPFVVQDGIVNRVWQDLNRTANCKPGGQSTLTCYCSEVHWLATESANRSVTKSCFTDNRYRKGQRVKREVH